MVNLMSSLYTTVDSLKINQSAMSVVSNNIANINTEGYSKQRLDFASVSHMPGSISQSSTVLAGGVEINKFTRYQDEILNGVILQQNSSYGYSTQMADNLSDVEAYFNEIDGSGLTGSLQDYYSAAQSLTNDPTNPITRANFITQAGSVANEFNVKYNALTTYREDLVGDGTSTASLKASQLGMLVEDINDKLAEITELNRQISIFTNQDNVQPNALLDKRQLLLDELAKVIPINARAVGSTVDVYVGNVALIENNEQVACFDAKPGTSVPLINSPDANDPAVVRIVSNSDNTIMMVEDYQTQFTSPQGQLKAMLDIGGNQGGSIDDVLTQLNDLAKEFARSVNEIQLHSDAGPPAQATLKLNSTTNQLEPATEPIFLSNSSTVPPYNLGAIATAMTAGNITLNSIVKNNPYELATAFGPVDNAAAPTVALEPNAIGNNNNSLAFFNMRDSQIIDGVTSENKLYLIAAQVGRDSALMQDKMDTQQTSLDQLLNKKQSLTGVSLDEELVDLMKYQKSYQASAQVFSAVSRMLEVIVNMVS